MPLRRQDSISDRMLAVDAADLRMPDLRRNSAKVLSSHFCKASKRGLVCCRRRARRRSPDRLLLPAVDARELSYAGIGLIRRCRAFCEPDGAAGRGSKASHPLDEPHSSVGWVSPGSSRPSGKSPRPASHLPLCLMMNAFCASENFDAFIAHVPSPVEIDWKSLTQTSEFLRS